VEKVIHVSEDFLDRCRVDTDVLTEFDVSDVGITHMPFDNLFDEEPTGPMITMSTPEQSAWAVDAESICLRCELVDEAVFAHAACCGEMHAALGSLLAFVERVGGYVTPEDAETIRRARCALRGTR
jgi:hypothetical protein